jgi:hypothetical protein
MITRPRGKKDFGKLVSKVNNLHNLNSDPVQLAGKEHQGGKPPCECLNPSEFLMNPKPQSSKMATHLETTIN